MNKRKKKNKGGKWEISFAPITRYSMTFCALVLIIILLGGGILSIRRMKTDADASLITSHAQISQRVAGAIHLLESLASLPEFYDPDLPPIEKVKKLDQMNPYFGYMMICYVAVSYTHLTLPTTERV